MNEEAGIVFVIFGIVLKIIGIIGCAEKAGELNRDKFGWGLFGFFMPIVAMIIVYCLKPVVDWHEESNMSNQVSSNTSNRVSSNTSNQVSSNTSNQVSSNTSNQVLNNQASRLSNLLYKQIEKIKSDRKADAPIWSGYAKFDGLTGGFRLGEFVVIGGRPGMGKTQLLTNLALNISKTHPVLFITYGDSEQAISQRFLSSISGIPIHKFKFKLKKEAKESLIQKTASFDNYHLFIMVNSNMPVEEVKNYCIRQIKDNGVKIIMINNLHARFSETSTYPDGASELAHITKELKNLAQQQQICVITTSPLSVEKRNGLSELYDLKNGTAIKENADKVLFIFHPEYYGFSEDEEENNPQNGVKLLY